MTDIYSKTPISEVIFKLDFGNTYNIKENIHIFYEKIKDKFPYDTINSEPEITINIENADGEIKTTHEPKSWYFHESEDINDSPLIIEVSKNYCLIDYRCDLREYEGYPAFKEEYIDLIIKSLSVFEIKEFTKIGLRYINNINCPKGNPLKWKDIIVDELLFDDLLNKYDSPSRLMSEFMFEKNDFFINFHYGIFNTEFPNPIARKEFTLDFDCMCKNETNVNEISEVVNDMHDTILELFKENVTKEYKEFIA